MQERRCTKVRNDGTTCDALLGHDMGDTFRNPAGVEIGRGMTWCPACGAEYSVRRYPQGKSHRIALRPTGAESTEKT